MVMWKPTGPGGVVKDGGGNMTGEAIQGRRSIVVQPVAMGGGPAHKLPPCVHPTLAVVGGAMGFTSTKDVQQHRVGGPAQCR